MEKSATEAVPQAVPQEQAEGLQQALQRMDDVTKLSYSLIADYVAGGWQQSLAKALCYLDEAHRSEALSRLPPEICRQLTAQLASMGEKKPSDPDVMAEAGNILKRKNFYGKKAAETVFDGLSAEARRQLPEAVQACYDKNPLLCLNVDRYLFLFEDIVRLDDRTIQKILRETDWIELARALKYSDKVVQEKIINNMSKRAAAMFREDMEYMGPVRLCDVYEAQDKIISCIKRLAAAGEIVLSTLGCVEDILV